MDGYRVDLAELENIDTRIAGFTGFLTETLTGLQQRIATLQQTWTGAAADAQAAAFRQWVAAATEAAEGIETMRQAAEDARTRYTTAVETNLRTLGRR
ncbi:WXG100 family type VII secretion target [Nocardia altamirensis]|uniref:WXG100 family type VII secretion target n=1 Tax=Nocardia altamirensis TaxID=472158 RepID=UPI00084055C0|nr:WXG100 family type VII secretion target [Nocardia altamirensis]